MIYKVTEIFKSIQGEGINVGRPSIFLRFYGCNLNCEWCDSKYSIKNNEYTEMVFDDIIREIDKLSNINITNLVITGGEPLLQIQEHGDPRLFLELIIKRSRYIKTIEIETNGILLNPRFIDRDSPYHYNMSPKFIKNWKLKYKYMLPDRGSISVKFVLEHGKNRKKCIRNILQFLKINMFSNRKLIYIMSEGTTKSELNEKRMQTDINFCMKHGFNYTPRLHILVWDKKRKV